MANDTIQAKMEEITPDRVRITIDAEFDLTSDVAALSMKYGVITGSVTPKDATIQSSGLALLIGAAALLEEANNG